MSTAPEPTEATRPSGVQYRARRSPRLIALGVLAIILGALGSVALHHSLTDTMSVVAVAQPIMRGETITLDALTVVDVPEGIAVPTSPSEHLESFVGQTALTDIPSGAFPLAEHVGADPLPEGEVLVGLRMQHGQMPVSAMPAGTQVMLVGLTTDTEAGGLEVPAMVSLAPQLLADGSTFTLDVRVPESQAVEVTRLAAGGQLAVMVVG